MFSKKVRNGLDTLKSSQFLALLALIFGLTVGSCKKEILTTENNSILFLLEDDAHLELCDLIIAPDGGFFIGSVSKDAGRQKIRIDRFSSELALMWTKEFGGYLDNQLPKLFLDRDNRLVVSAFSYGIGRQKEPLGEHRWWSPSIFILDPNGTAVWSGFADQIGGSLEQDGRSSRIADIIQNKAGNFILVGECGQNGEFYMQPIFLNVVLNGGETIEEYKTFDAYGTIHNQFGKSEAVLETSDGYLVLQYFQNEPDSTPKLAALKMNQNDVPDSTGMSQTDWPFGSTYDAGQIGVFKDRNDASLKVNYVFPNRVTRVGYDPNKEEFYTQNLSLPFSGIRTCHQISDEKYLLIDPAGKAHVTDKEFVWIASFEQDLDFDRAIELQNGSLITASGRGGNIYIRKIEIQP